MAQMQTSKILLPRADMVAVGAAASGYGSALIKVTPETLEEKAAELRSRLARIRSEFDEMTRAIERTAAYWSGEAAEVCRKCYRDTLSGREQMLSCLDEHAANLQEIALTYIGVQDKVTRMAAALPSDAIE